MNKGRIKWIDTLKGIGIILVILGHSPISPGLGSYIYTFHMPLFFFISGYLFNRSKYNKFSRFLISRARSILLPYFWFSVLSIAIYVITAELGKARTNIDWIGILKAFLFSQRNSIFYDVPLWFLTCLFLVEIVFFFLRKHLKKDGILISTMIILAYIGLIPLHALDAQHQMPWAVNAVLFYLLFYGTANLIRENVDKFSVKSRYIFLGLMLLFSCLILTHLNQLSSWLVGSFGINQTILTIVAAFAGIFSSIAFANILMKSYTLNFLGRNVLIYFTLHVPLGFYVASKLEGYFHIQFQMPEMLGIFFTVVSLVVLTPLALVINKYCSFMIGHKNI